MRKSAKVQEESEDQPNRNVVVKLASLISFTTLFLILAQEEKFLKQHRLLVNRIKLLQRLILNTQVITLQYPQLYLTHQISISKDIQIQPLYQIIRSQKVHSSQELTLQPQYHHHGRLILRGVKIELKTTKINFKNFSLDAVENHMKFLRIC